MVFMISVLAYKDQDVVKIYDAKVVKVFMEGVVDIILEGCRSICKSKGHNKVLVIAIMYIEHYLPFISLSDLNEVVS